MQRTVEEHASWRGLYPLPVHRLAFPRGVLHEPYPGIDMDDPMIERRKDVFRVAEVHVLALESLSERSQIVDSEDDVLCRRDDRLSARGREQVVRREHKHPRLRLGLQRKRYVDGHLVSVEVGVEGRADERVEADRLTFDKHGLKSLDTETVQRRGAVQHDGMIFDDPLEDSPYLVAAALDETARALDVRREPAFDELVHDERLEELQRHLLRKPALVDLEVRPDHDDGTARIVDALSEKVLAETPLLAAQKVRQALERAVACAEHGLSAAAVVNESVHRFLQHPLFIAHDDLRRFELLELAQAVVAVYDPAVEVVEVGGRETSAVKLHHRTKVRRDDGQHGKDHPFGTRIALTEILRHLKPLDELPLFLARTLGYLLAELVDERVDVYLAKQRIDALSADPCLESLVIGGADDLFALKNDIPAHEGRVAALDHDVARIFDRLSLFGRLEALRIFLRVKAEFALRDDVVLREGQSHDGGDDIGLLIVEHGAFGFQLGIARQHHLFLRIRDHLDAVFGVALLIYTEGRLDLEQIVSVIAAEAADLGRRDDVAVVHGHLFDLCDAVSLFGLEFRVIETVDALLRGRHQRTAAREVYPASFVDHLIDLLAAARRGEVDYLFELLCRGSQQKAETARDAAQIPDMHDRRRQLYMPHLLTAYAVVGHFDAAALADDAAELRPAALIFAAGALIAPDGAKDTLAEKAVLLRAERPVVYGLRLLDLPAGEFPDSLGRGKLHSYSGDFMTHICH